MKLEMRYGELDVRLDIGDQSSFYSLEIMEDLKNIISLLSEHESVSLVITSVPKKDDVLDDKN